MGFAEAKTVSSDPQEITIPDPTHSFDEDRYLRLGRSKTERSIVVPYAERHEDSMNKEIEDDAMLPEYDFSKGMRGKHYRAYRRGTTVVLSNGNRGQDASTTDPGQAPS